MPTRIVEGQLPYTGGTGIEIDTNKVISILLREEDNLIKVNGDNELYTDLQLAVNITPSSDFPVGVTVGKVLAEDGWSQNGLILHRQTTSGDYARRLYGADGKLYFDNGTGTWKQVYYSSEVDALFTALRGELATVAFSGDYNDLINRPAFLQVQADWNQTDDSQPDYIKNKPTIPTVNDATLTIQKNGTGIATFTANSSTNVTANITVPNVINNVTSTSTSDALSANQGKSLQDQINDLKAIGRFLSLWDASTGQPISFPLSTPYNYQTGDYFLVETVSSATPPVNYRPSGTQYTGTASSTAESEELEVGDLYIYDGTVWLLQMNHGKSVTFANIAGQPTDNANLATALGNKQDTLVSGTNIKTINNTSILGSGDLTVGGDVVGPASSTDGHLAVFDGAGGKTIKDGGAVPTGVPSGGTDGQVLSKVSGSVAWANAPESSNTKTFYLSSTSDLTKAQDAYDWYLAGKNPIVVYNNQAYILLFVSASSIKFIAAQPRVGNIIPGTTTESTSVVSFTLSSGTVTAITQTSYNVNVLNANTDYAIPYTPQYDGSPATKKYVDDHGVPSGGNNGDVLTNVSGTPTWQAPSGGISLDANSPITVSKLWVGTEAQYSALATKSNDTIYMTV